MTLCVIKNLCPLCVTSGGAGRSTTPTNFFKHWLQQTLPSNLIRMTNSDTNRDLFTALPQDLQLNHDKEHRTDECINKKHTHLEIFPNRLNYMMFIIQFNSGTTRTKDQNQTKPSSPSLLLRVFITGWGMSGGSADRAVGLPGLHHLH